MTTLARIVIRIAVRKLICVSPGRSPQSSMPPRTCHDAKSPAARPEERLKKTTSSSSGLTRRAARCPVADVEQWLQATLIGLRSTAAAA
jgi:hypothetical protein